MTTVGGSIEEGVERIRPIWGVSSKFAGIGPCIIMFFEFNRETLRFVPFGRINWDPNPHHMTGGGATGVYDAGIFFLTLYGYAA